MKRKYCEQYFK